MTQVGGFCCSQRCAEAPGEAGNTPASGFQQLHIDNAGVHLCLPGNSGFQIKWVLTEPDSWVLFYKLLCVLGWGCEPPGWAPCLQSSVCSFPLRLDFWWNLTHKHSMSLVSSWHSRHFLMPGCAVCSDVATKRMQEEVVYMYNEILLSHKNEWNIVIGSNVDGPRYNHTKWSKPGWDKYHTLSLVGGI